MFHFPSFAFNTYVFSVKYLPCSRWVSPFRHPRIKGLLPPPRSFSQAYTSFIALTAKASTVCTLSLDYITPNSLFNQTKKIRKYQLHLVNNHSESVCFTVLSTLDSVLYQNTQSNPINITYRRTPKRVIYKQLDYI